SVSVPITRSAPRPDAVVPGENVAVAGVMTAHRGVAHHLIEGPWDVGLDAGSWRPSPRATYPDSAALQFLFAGHGGGTRGDPARAPRTPPASRCGAGAGGAARPARATPPPPYPTRWWSRAPHPTSGTCWRKPAAWVCPWARWWSRPGWAPWKRPRP